MDAITGFHERFVAAVAFRSVHSACAKRSGHLFEPASRADGCQPVEAAFETSGRSSELVGYGPEDDRHRPRDPKRFGSVVAMDSGGDGSLYALTGTRPTSSRDPVCSAGCRVQRIDPSTRRVVTQRAIVGPFAGSVRLRHDAWAGRALVFAPSTCGTSYPYACTGWSVWTAAYE